MNQKTEAPVTRILPVWKLPDRIDGRGLLVVRAVWLFVAVGLTALVVFGFIAAYRDPQLLSIPALTELFTELNLGLPLMITVALVGPYAAVVVVSAIVFLRRSDDPMALLLTCTLLVFYAYATRSLIAFQEVAVLDQLLDGTFALSAVLLTLTLGLFPNGVFVPRWVVWLSPAMLGLLIWNPKMGSALMGAIDQSTNLTGRTRYITYGFVAIWFLGVLAQITRYRRSSTPIEQQQTKWVIAPLALWITMILAALTLSVAGSSERTASWIILLSLPINSLIPISLGIAVMKYRLYEIDKIISRTLGYALVVGILGCVYGAGAVWLPSRFAGESSLFVAASTLVVVGLFNPIRHRVLRWVDRLFYRSSFDSSMVVENFSVRIRDQTDPSVVADELIDIVNTTMQPSAIGLWTRPTTKIL